MGRPGTDLSPLGVGRDPFSIGGAGRGSDAAEEALRQGRPLGISYRARGPRNSGGEALRALFLVKNALEVVHGAEGELFKS